MFEVATKEKHGYQCRRHDLCISHFLLAVFPMVKRFQEVVTQRLKRQDVVVHGGPPRAGGGGSPPRTLADVLHGCQEVATWVNLFVWMPSRDVAVGGLPSGLPLCGHGYTRDFLPDLESLGHLLAIRGSGKPVASRAEVLGNGTIGGKEALGVTGDLNPCMRRAR
jgi:hypothetical protein